MPSSAAGKYSRSANRVRSRCLVRSHTSFWWARAAILTASATSLSAASSRIWCRRVRPMSARQPASKKSSFFPEFATVSLCRAACLGLAG